MLGQASPVAHLQRDNLVGEDKLGRERHLPEQQHKTLVEISEVVVAVYRLVGVFGDVPKHLQVARRVRHSRRVLGNVCLDLPAFLLWRKWRTAWRSAGTRRAVPWSSARTSKVVYVLCILASAAWSAWPLETASRIRLWRNFPGNMTPHQCGNFDEPSGYLVSFS